MSVFCFLRYSCLVSLCMGVMSLPVYMAMAQEGQPVASENQDVGIPVEGGDIPDSGNVVIGETTTETVVVEVPDDSVPEAEESELEEIADESLDAGASISGPSAAEPTAEDFFDAENLVPQGEMAKRGPVKVDPKLQPASKLIIVKKNYEADTQTAQIASAERAMTLGRYDSALQMFDGLYTETTRDSRVLMGRAVCLQKLGRFDESMQAYEKLAAVEPNNVDIKVNMLGLLATRYPSVALRRLLEIHEKNSTHAGLTAQIAMAYAKTGDVESAMRYFGIATSMEPNNANHLFNMAVILDRAGQKKEAVNYYEQALEVDTVHGGGRSIPREAVFERLARLR